MAYCVRRADPDQEEQVDGDVALKRHAVFVGIFAVMFLVWTWLSMLFIGWLHLRVARPIAPISYGQSCILGVGAYGLIFLWAYIGILADRWFRDE